MRTSRLWLVIVVLAAWLLWQRHLQSAPPTTPAVGTPARTAPTVARAQSLPAFLPTEATVTLQLIAQGGPFPHPQDGGVFGNYEGRLPHKPRGYYHEYTVETPGAGNRGARRIVTGGNPPDIYYYTDDHYDSFRRFEVAK
ncbi:MAG: ribonuclease [Proteobacteria bacterium]|nr:ribonuclease [Pseudomonadota bacterium]MBS0462379.1 ribonuclease [Pseudomonadota bacterium]MBS0463669.1 ribonuclease [Pseudomonadota bacterium]